MIDQALGFQPAVRRKNRENSSETFLPPYLDLRPNHKSTDQTLKHIKRTEETVKHITPNTKKKGLRRKAKLKFLLPKQ